MAIVRFANEVIKSDPDTFKAFYTQFPQAEEIQLPNGAQDYKLFRVNGDIHGKPLPSDDDIIVLKFAKKPDGPIIIIGWEEVWYNNVQGDKITKNLDDLNAA